MAYFQKRKNIILGIYSISLVYVYFTSDVNTLHSSNTEMRELFFKESNLVEEEELNTNDKQSECMKDISRDNDDIPTIYAITPTYARPTQKAELTRLSNKLRNVGHLTWIVIEDSINKTELVTELLQRSGVPHVHLNVKSTIPKSRHRGLQQRNIALNWIRHHVNKITSQLGVFYFADDDNAYDLQLFEEVCIIYLGMAKGSKRANH